jgi:outer membrane protein
VASPFRKGGLRGIFSVQPGLIEKLGQIAILEGGEPVKKNLLLIILTILIAVALPGTVQAIGLEIAAGAWLQSPSGTLSYKAIDPNDLLDLENDLKYDDETRFSGRLKIDMPLFLPNIYLMATPMEFEGDGIKTSNFKFGDSIIGGTAPFYSNLNLNHADIALYYGIPGLQLATLDILNIDIGLNVRIYDAEARIVQQSTSIDVTESITVPIPQVFLALQFRPFDFLALEAEGRGISIGGNKAYSLIGRLRWNVFGPLFLAGGYRYDKIEIDEEELFIDTDFSGPFAELGLSF